MALTKDEKWNAVIHCDHSYDGLFFYGVKTTGIFCRPSCKSKKPLRNNVAFFDKVTEAYDCGLRPCKRCRPDLLAYRPMLDLIEQARRSMDTYFTDRQRLVAEIKKLGISQNYLIHLFRQQYHMTPVEYITTLRIEKARQMLHHTDTKIVTIALLCGFGSLSNFYGFFKKQIGLTPSEYRKQSRGDRR